MPAPVMGSITPMPEGHTMATDSPPRPEGLSQAEAQWLFTEEELHWTPSVLAGMSIKQERQNRAKGVNFILQVGILLKLPQITLATAAVFLHRFFMRYSMEKDPSKQRQDFHYYSVAAASVWLAAKVEENCRKMKEVVVACVRVAQKDSNKVVDEQDKEYWRWRDTIIALEDKLLEGLCFDLSLESPYTVLYGIMCRFDAQDNKVFRNAAWAFVNDSCLTPLCVLFPSRTIAAAGIYAAARSCKLDFLDEEGKPWWSLIGVPLADIRRACNYMADVYEDAPLREGARQDLYQRTPINGDERTAKTRASHQQQQDSNNNNNPSGSDADVGSAPSTAAIRFAREGSIISNTGSDASRKRSRAHDDDDDNDEHDGDNSNSNSNSSSSNNNHVDGSVREHGQQPVSMNDVPWGGETPRARETKRVRQEAAINGTASMRPSVDKMQVDGDARARLNGASAALPKEPGAEPLADMQVEKLNEQMGAVSPDLGGSEEGELDE